MLWWILTGYIIAGFVTMVVISRYHAKDVKKRMDAYRASIASSRICPRPNLMPPMLVGFLWGAVWPIAVVGGILFLLISLGEYIFTNKNVRKFFTGFEEPVHKVKS